MTIIDRLQRLSLRFKMNKTLLAVIVLALAGCNEQAVPEKQTGVRFGSYVMTEICYDGVTYIIGFRIMSVKFNSDSTVVTCNDRSSGGD